MANNSYERGKIKVVWVEQDPQKIYSKMFDTEKAAERFVKGKKEDYIIFALETQSNMEEFSWRILPYGKYKLYSLLVKSLHLSKANLLQVIKKALSS